MKTFLRAVGLLVLATLLALTLVLGTIGWYEVAMSR